MPLLYIIVYDSRMSYSGSLGEQGLVENMNKAMIILVATQILYSLGDFLARANMTRYGFCLAAFPTRWFALYFLMRNVAMLGQLWVFSSIPLGKSMALFVAVSIVLSNVLGFLFLKEILHPSAYIGISLAVLAFFVMMFR